MLISHDFSLKTLTTFGVEVRAKQFIVVSSTADLQELFEEGYLKQRPRMVLGGGSNLLFTDHYPGLILSCRMKGKETVKETEDEIWIRVNSGEYWPAFVDEMVEKGYGGIENLSLIPGKVGAAPVQNIGAYGVEVKDVIESVEAFDMDTGAIKTFQNEVCTFGYRSSIFKTKMRDKLFILNVTFRLSKQPEFNLTYAPLQAFFKGKKKEDITLKEVSEAVKKIRRSKLPEPDDLNNAGSFFKNPVVPEEMAAELKKRYPDMPVYPQAGNKVKLAAGWLIEQCGWKGKRAGDVGVYEKQALILVNYGRATGREIADFSFEIRKNVREQFGVDLHPEITIL